MQGKQADEDEFDMFTAEKVDDMFGDAPVGAPVPLQKAPKRGLLDNYDDSEGYYNFQVFLAACLVVLSLQIIFKLHEVLP